MMMGQPGMPMGNQTSQILFAGPDGMNVAWDMGAPGQFDSEPLICPGRYEFPRAAIYRLKLTNIEGHPGAELFPTLEVGPASPRTEAFLSHNAIPVRFTPEDFDQVQSGNFVTKVIYLPDPEFQGTAVAGVDTLVSTRLDPGVDPIQEADTRGSVLAVVRLGNKVLGLPGSMSGQEEVVRAGYMMQAAGPMGAPGGGMPMMPGSHISGVTAPQYGIPISATPIGLPGPPHVPLGAPAGLQSYTIKNHTRMHIPGPTSHVKVNVKQTPGFSYPKPANRVRIVERTFAPLGLNTQPIGNRVDVISPNRTESYSEMK